MPWALHHSQLRPDLQCCYALPITSFVSQCDLGIVNVHNTNFSITSYCRMVITNLISLLRCNYVVLTGLSFKYYFVPTEVHHN